jgi:beta-aspartyl-dipeptidase (metallo-type)
MLKLTQFFPTTLQPQRLHPRIGQKEFAKRGGYIDITTSSYPYFPEYEVKPSKCIPLLLEAGIPIEKITFTSDACGSLPGFDENGNLVKLEMGLPSANFRELMDAVNQEGVPLEIAVKVLTSNPADILKLHQKGRIAVGKDADLVFIDNQRIYHVMAMGKFMMKDAQILKKGSYEK